MMDAVKYLKTLRRMCIYECSECELRKRFGVFDACDSWQKANPEEAVAIVEKWVAEHPVKTRQGEFLKHYPDVVLDGNGIINISPCRVDQKQHPFNGKDCCKFQACSECRREFWGHEVE